MAEFLAAFLQTLGPEFDGKAETILQATGATDLDELVDLVEIKEDLRDLEKPEAGMKILHVKKLFRAIMQEKERRAADPSLTQEAVPPAQPETTVMYPKLERVVSAIPEDDAKDPSEYVACSNPSKHEVEQAALTKQKPRVFKGTAGKQSGGASEPFASGGGYASDFPSLGPAAPVPRVTAQAQKQGTGASAAMRLAAVAAEERRAAEETSAANAAIARQVLGRPAHELRRQAYDRVVEFYWDKVTWTWNKGRAEFGANSPICELSEEDFEQELISALKKLCEAHSDLSEPGIEDVLVYEPDPAKKKGKEPKPHALVLFKSLDDVQHLEHIYQLHWNADDRRQVPVLTMKGQKVLIQRPNPDYVRRAASSLGHSENGTEKAGSEHSHSSTAQSEYRNSTLLFSNIPEAMHVSMSQKPATKQAIENWVSSVLDAPPAIPVSRDAFSFSASFSEPRKAPYGCCWLTFKYVVEGKRISAEDGKAYSLQAFRNLYKDKKADAVVLRMWTRSTDAVFELEKKIGGDGKPTSVARWFMDRVKEKRVEAPDGKEKNKIWSSLKLLDNQIAVEFKRPERSS
eukprot:TRINITY_DN76139_c0_g1_i1.p1 TRINITY_DN76139_c0_g1~~TRINITY_DN76139_c0_g1_i1.p1  ORF type:complete len:602 (-),score=134.20 TRINITY_DN76139_c0_g1_i1:105-1823(-)